jgi:RNA polymerase-binding protein DksA
MKAEDLPRFRTRLLVRKATLHDEVRADLAKARSEGSAEFAQDTHDLGDDSFADVTTDLAIADARRDLMELRGVEAALRRIDQGTYGSCVTCEGPIGMARLEAYPSAKRCLRCETVFERQTGQSAAHSL